MGSRVFTVYFRNFPESFDVPELTDMFQVHGDIIKLFVHHTRTYGMVEYADVSACNKAIEHLHQQPPLNLYVKMARSNNKKEKTTDLDGESVFSSSSSKKDRDGELHGSTNSLGDQRTTRMSYSNTIISQPTVRDEENVFYVDRFNKVLDVMVDDRGIVYVPLHTVADVANIRRVKRKSFSATACDYETNPDNYIELDKPPNEERNQQHSFRDRRTVRHASRDEEPAGRQRHNSSMINGHEPPPGLQVTVKNMRRRNGESTEDESLENKREAGKSSGSRVPTRTPVSPRPAAVKSAPARRIKNEPAEDDWSENSRPQRDQKRPTKPIGASTATTTTNRSQETRPSSAGFKQLSYSLVELSGTQFTTITVTDVLNETDVWVQLEELADSLAELTYRVIQEAVDAEPISAAVGQLCLAQFEGVWYRAVLLGTRPCRVRYIDFGNEQSEPEGGTLTISNALAALPAHALHVRLPRARSLEEGDKLRVKQRSIMDGVHLVQPEDEPDVTAAVAAPPAYDKFVLKRLQQNQSGLLLAAMKFSDDKFVGGLLPGEFEEELQALNALCEQCPRLSGYSPAPGDLVAARLEPEGWCRALLQERLPAGKYRVAFVDYGKEETVRELRPVPEDKRNIPWFCCVCTVPAQHVDSLLKTECLRYSVVSCADTSIRLRLKEEGGEEDMCSAEVSGWWPTVPAASDLDVPQAEPALGLKSGDKVQLLTENNGLLYVRNKRSRELLDRVSELMRRWEPFAPFLAKRPPPGQLVAAEFGKDWYRAQVLQVSGDQATVLYVDYGNEERLPWSGLKELSEELLRIPHTAFKVRLEGFEDGSFSTKQTSRLEQLAHYRTLLTIAFEGGEQEQLVEGQRREETVRLASRDGTQLRAELERLRLDDRPSPFLKALSVCAAAAATGSKWRVPRDDEPRITMCSLPQQEVAFGCQRVRVLDLINPERGLFTFCLADERAERRINEELRDLIHGYVLHVDSLGGAAAPYRPEDDEVLLARDPQVDEWRRAVVAQSSPGNEGYVHVFYVDHGRLQDVSPRDVRRISPDLTSPPTIAFFSCMHGLPAQLSARARDRIHELMTPGVAFDARLLRKDESDIYIMQLPELTARLQADKLI